jgi:DNA segregation ATPase FtsK/SpoIIIE, S-DNA-T family
MREEEIEKLYQDAKVFVIEKQECSPSLLQIHFKLGYNMAGRIVDRLFEEGIVSDYEYPKGRKVLTSPQ